MEENGRRSCTGNSRHVNIRYFYVKDLIDKKQVRVMYCPTSLMLADFFTKALQGKLFHFFRNIVMGYVSAHEVIAINPEMKERVENLEKYQKDLISKMKLDDAPGLRTYREDNVRTDKKQNNKSADDESSDIRKKISFCSIANRTYAAIASTGDYDKHRNQINKRSDKDH